MPSSYNGIYSIKPSPGRLSFKDAVGSGLGNLAITAVAGIMGPYISSLRLVFKSLMQTRPWLYDPAVLPIPWRDDEEVQQVEHWALASRNIMGSLLRIYPLLGHFEWPKKL
jgi:amidase